MLAIINYLHLGKFNLSVANGRVASCKKLSNCAMELGVMSDVILFQNKLLQLNS